MIEEDYVSFETAKLLKEKGFDEDIDLWYDEDGGMFFKHRYDIITDYRVKHNQEVYQCPSLQMAMKWLREVYQIHIEIGFNEGYFPVCISTLTNDTIPYRAMQGKPFKYEEACEAAIKYCLENLI